MGSGTARLASRHQEVELLTVIRSEKGYDIAAQHAVVQFDLRFGVLMLCGIHDEFPVFYFLNDDDDSIKLMTFDKYYLMKKFNRFKLGNLEFKLIYGSAEEKGCT